MKTILLTGGGTAGHVTPNLALIPSLKAAGYDIRYIGSYNGMERKLIENAGIPYDGISSGKLRRYFDLKNFTDPFRVLKGYAEALKLMKKYKPDVLFSKGGLCCGSCCPRCKALPHSDDHPRVRYDSRSGK
mgnify:CR=1 FL=1